MLMVLGAELGKLIFSGVLNRYFKRRGCCIRLGKRGANSSPLSCEANQGSLGDEEGRKCGPGCPLGEHTSLYQRDSGGSVISLWMSWNHQQWGTLWLSVLVICVTVTKYHRPSSLESVHLLVQS